MSRQDTSAMSARKIRFYISIIFVYFISNPLTQAEELIMSAAPRESAEAGHTLYTPIANHIGNILGVKVRYKHPRHWLRYQSDIKKEKYDIVLDGPHLASWRIKYIGHKPLMKLPVPLQFHLLIKADNNAIKVPEDLAYKRVCAIPPPNLTSVVLLQRLNDPIREPVIHGVKGGMKKIFKTLIDGKCTAAIVRTDFYDKKLSDEQRQAVKILYTSPKLPGQVITVSKRIPEEGRQALLDSFTAGDGVQVMSPVVKRFAGKNIKSFVPAEANEYDQYYKFLQGVVLGW